MKMQVRFEVSTKYLFMNFVLHQLKAVLILRCFLLHQCTMLSLLNTIQYFLHYRAYTINEGTTRLNLEVLTKSCNINGSKV